MRVGTCGSSNGPTHDPTPHDRLFSFSIHYTNIRGLHSNFSSVEAHLATSSPNLFLLSETQLSSQSSPDPFQISRYNLYSRFRYKGGVAAYCNINTPIARLMDLESPHFDVLWLKIYLPTTTIILCFYYCSPNATDFLSFFEYLTSCHESLLTKHPHAEVLYIGDFNVRHTDWLQSTHTDVGGIEAFHFSISNELEQIIKHPTRVPDRHDHTANTLDLFFTSNPQNYTYTVSSPLGSSDHCTVSVTSSVTPPPPIPPTQRHLWHFENVRHADMSNFLLNFPWNDYCFRTRDPDLAATAVGEVVDSGMRANIPYSLTTFSPSNPWFDRASSSAISDREGAHRSYQASPSEFTHATFISARNRCSAKLRRARSSFRERKIDKLNSSPTEKCFWSLSKKIFNNFCNSSFPSLIRPDGSIACSTTDKANLFGSYFSANSSLSDFNAPDPPTQPLSNPIPSIIISARKVRRVLRSLKTDKASGPDGVPPRFLKEFAEELAPVLCRLFRLILISCTYPSSWKHALVQPVPKKGDRSNPSNYRPIALTSAVAKVFETLLNSHFIKHLESNNLLSDHQYGFRKARSTGDLLSYLTHTWSSSLRDFGESFVIALDISKAFDRVWHKALLAKLPAYGFTPSFCKLISSFLSDRFISVVVDGATSASFPVSSGVPQGSVLSPTLFLLFINDLLHATASDVHSFADDSNLHKSSSFQCQPSSNACSQSRLAISSTITSDLQSISEWGTRNLVKFNTSKTQLLTISLSNTPSNYPIILEDSEIPPLNSVNILGLQISSSLSWRDHIVQIAKSA